MLCEGPGLSLVSFPVERARVNVRAKGSGVNSVFLVQLRKNVVLGCRGTQERKACGPRRAKPHEGRGFAVEERPESDARKAERRIGHSGCTGNAEVSSQ